MKACALSVACVDHGAPPSKRPCRSRVPHSRVKSAHAATVFAAVAAAQSDEDDEDVRKVGACLVSNSFWCLPQLRMFRAGTRWVCVVNSFKQDPAHAAANCCIHAGANRCTPVPIA